jgi:hypothetical protein
MSPDSGNISAADGATGDLPHVSSLSSPDHIGRDI